MNDRLFRRLARLEQETGAGYPVFRVTFEDGSTRKMRAYELVLYAVARSVYVKGHTGGLFDDDPADLAFVDYQLIRGDASKLSTYMIDEIEHMKGK